MPRAAELRVGGGLAWLIALACLAGCGGRPSGSSNVQVDPGKKDGPGQPDKTNTPAAPKSATGFAKDFLQSVGEQKGRPEDLAPEFVRILARPISEDDKKVGYNPVVARGWLDRQGPADFEVKEQFHSGNAADGLACLRGTVAVGGKPAGHFGLLCLGGNGKYRAAWFYRCAATVSMPTAERDSPALATALAFCDNLIGGDAAVAEALMATALKASLADPFAADKDIGYSPARLKSLVLPGLKGEATGYKLTKHEAAADGKTYMLSGELTAAGKARPFTLTLTKDSASGLWLVSAFKAG